MHKYQFNITRFVNFLAFSKRTLYGLICLIESYIFLYIFKLKFLYYITNFYIIDNQWL
jgi:hypothetical protein